MPSPNGMSPPFERGAADWSWFQTYTAFTQKFALTFCHSRVSTRIPCCANCFQTRVPTGNTHSFGSEASMTDPAGSPIQRRLSAPSDHNV